MFWLFFSLILALAGIKVHYALILGIALSLIMEKVSTKNHFLVIDEKSKKASKYSLQLGVAILGLCLPFSDFIALGGIGFIITAISIICILILGIALGKILKIDRSISYLISFGTAICGGSAIAAMGSTLKAKGNEMAVSLGIVFLLNALALFIFPSIGHYFELTDRQFGLWAALSIHDTSSVVGAASLWSEEALKLATSFKLVRALWIVPYSAFFSYIFNQEHKNKADLFAMAKVPKFIIAFVLCSVLASFIDLNSIEAQIKFLAKACMSYALFLIGLNLNFKQLKQIQYSAFLQAFILWTIISISSLFLIKFFFV